MAEGMPDVEKIAEREALKQSIESARLNIERQRGDMAQSTTNAAGEVGMVKSLWNVMQERQGKMKELAWKDLKATAAGALSVIPLVGEAGTVAKIGSAAEAGKTYMKVRKLDNVARKSGVFSWVIERSLQKGKFIDALKNVPRNPVHLISDPFQSGKEAWGARKGIQEIGKTADQVARFGEVGALGGDPSVIEANLAEKMIDAQKTYSGAKKQLGKDVLISTGLSIMHKIDPFPDVPPALTTVAGLAEFVLPGSNILPALWQLGHNKIEWAKAYGGMALDMGKVVMNRFDRKLTGMKEPQVARAAAAFHYG